MHAILATLYFFITFFIMSIIGVPYMLTKGIRGRWNECTEICIHYFNFMFRLFRIKLTVEGQENIPEKKGFVMVANHQSFMDINVLWPAVGTTAFLAKSDLWKPPIFSWVLTNIGCIPVNRRDPRKNAGMGKLVEDRLSKGYNLTVFPEGKRSVDGKLLKFQHGIFRMAKEHHFPILPITIIGTAERLPKTRWALVPGEVKVVIHPVVNPDDYAEMQMGDLRDKVHETIESALPYKIAEANAQKEAPAENAEMKEA